MLKVWNVCRSTAVENWDINETERCQFGTETNNGDLLSTTTSNSQNSYNTVKPVFVRVPFISRISQAWQVRANNGPQKFEYSSISV